jgi:beta-glucosidase
VGHAREHPESGWILVTQSLSHGIAVANSKLDNAGRNHGHVSHHRRRTTAQPVAPDNRRVCASLQHDHRLAVRAPHRSALVRSGSRVWEALHVRLSVVLVLMAVVASGCVSEDDASLFPSNDWPPPSSDAIATPVTIGSVPGAPSTTVPDRSESTMVSDIPVPSALDEEGAFVWGTATSAYQVEGGHDVDGKGPSVWDVYTNEGGITELLTGRVQTANTAVDYYDLDRFRADLESMVALGVDVYRFSISWSRVIPDGTGRVNESGLRYYRTVVEELWAAGIEPVVTLFHWDLPQALADQGGFADRRSIEWFADYAEVVFDELADLVPTFLTINEPEAYTFLVEPTAQAITNDLALQIPLPAQRHAALAPNAHHLLLAHAAAVERYRSGGHGGRIGIVVNTSPAVAGSDDPADAEAATLADELSIGWFLDPLYRGSYPARARAAVEFTGVDSWIREGDLERIAEARPDVLGVNYYAPDLVVADPDSEHFGITSLPNPDPVPMLLGPVRPDRLTELLVQLTENYGRPVLLVTENGASFPDDDELVDGAVDDARRVDYISRHVDATLDARDAGADVRGYFVWSFVDNFEWFFGYDRRFGIIHVDHLTQTRTPKFSYRTYQRIVATDGAVTR